MNVSIITVCFNAQDTIEETIQSVLAQTYNNIEYIVVDGKSNDNTVPIINKYRNRITTFISEKDNGIYDAMNKGVSRATGEIIFFLNSGDIFFNNKVVENVVRDFKEDDVDIVYGDVIFLDPDTSFAWVKVHRDLDKIYLYDDMVCHQGLFAKSWLFRKYGVFDQKYKISADYEWLLRILSHHKAKLKYTNLVISIFKMDGISSNPNNYSIHLAERERIKRNYYSKLELFLFGSKLFRKIIDMTLRKVLINIRRELRNVFSFQRLLSSSNKENRHP